MNKDVKSFLLLVALLLAVLFLLRKRKPLLTQTSVQLFGARSMEGELNPAFTGDIKDELNQTFQRICKYNGTSIVWPSIGDPCPPTFNGQSLTADELARKL